MPRKVGIVKTYGRHKYRMVKSDLWVSPESDRDEIFRSPVAKKERIPCELEDTSTDRKLRNKPWAQPLSTRTNLPEQRWKLPRKKPSFTNSKTGKENSPCWDQLGRSDAQQRNDSTTQRKCHNSSTAPALSMTKKDLLGRTPLMMTEDSVKEKSFNNKFILAHDTGEEHNLSPQLTDLTKDGSLECVQDSWDISSQRSEEIKTSSTCNVQVISSTCKSLTSTEELRYQGSNLNTSRISVSSDDSSCRRAKHFHSSTSPAVFLNASVMVSPLVSDSVNLYSSKPDAGMRYITSTPLEGIVSRNCDKSVASASKTPSLSNCEVVIQPLQITSILQRRSNCSMTKPRSLENQGDLDCVMQEPDKLYAFAHSPCIPHSVKVLPLLKQNGEASTESSGEIEVKSHQGELLKECVVSLERLRLTPLVKERKRLSAARSAQTNSIHSPQTNHLSFMEALSPAIKGTHTDEECHSKRDNHELTPLEKVLLECEQDKPITFKQYLKPSVLNKCVKVGEGVYGEVFKTTNAKRQQVALKIIPVEGDFPVNGEAQKTFEEILPEILISKELSALGGYEELEENTTPNFIRVHKVSCCRDKYPAKLLKQWDKWDKENASENDRPEFPDDQLFIVFEFANGGHDLERFEFESISEAFGVLHQTTLALAVAENALEFEHRDLHWGNVLISRTARDTVEYRLNGDEHSLDTHGIFVSVIDFTLSRLTKENLTVFGNLAKDESLFTGKGDYQFDIYRLMRKTNKNEWEHFEPYTNVLWLHYLADKMLKNKSYAVQEKGVAAKMKRFLRQARRYKSATEMIEYGILL